MIAKTTNRSRMKMAACPEEWNFCLTIIRHGETDHNRNKIIQGQDDTVLNETGEEQVELVGNRFKYEHVTRVYSSDLQRAVKTAEGICLRNRHLKEMKLYIEPLLRERNYGDAEGKSRVELKKMLYAGKLPFGAETEAQVHKRAVDFFGNLIRDVNRLRKTRSTNVLLDDELLEDETLQEESCQSKSALGKISHQLRANEPSQSIVTNEPDQSRAGNETCQRIGDEDSPSNVADRPYQSKMVNECHELIANEPCESNAINKPSSINGNKHCESCLTNEPLQSHVVNESHQLTGNKAIEQTQIRGNKCSQSYDTNEHCQLTVNRLYQSSVSNDICQLTTDKGPSTPSKLRAKSLPSKLVSSKTQLISRTPILLKDLQCDAESNEDGPVHVIIVSHGGIIRHFLSYFSKQLPSRFTPTDKRRMFRQVCPNTGVSKFAVVLNGQKVTCIECLQLFDKSHLI